MSNCLLKLCRCPSKVAPGDGGFDKVFRRSKFPVEMQECGAAMRLQGTDHLHGIALCVIKAIQWPGNRAAGGEIGICAIACSRDTLKLRDKVAGAAVDGLSGEGAWECSVGCLHLLHDGVTRGQRIIHAGHVRGKEFRKACIEKECLTDGIGCGC